MLALWTGVTDAQTIQLVNPSQPRGNDLVAIAGHGFGEQPGARVVSLVRRFVAETPTAAERACRMPIVHWSANRILALASCPPDAYVLAIRRATELVRAHASNEVPLTVGAMVPRAAGFVPGMPQLRHVHPELVLAGGYLDLYGDFPMPDPATDRVHVMRSLAGAAARVPPQVVATLEPVEIATPHLRVRVPASLEPGEYFLVYAKNPVQRSQRLRVLVRSIPPAEWELASALPGSQTVLARLASTVHQVGVERRELDVLGYGLGAQQTGVYVHLLSDAELADVLYNLRHKKDTGAPIRPALAAQVAVVSWSDTRVRLRHVSGRFPPGEFNLVVSVLSERWSSPIKVQFPAE
jgi:hypothetical protein